MNNDVVLRRRCFLSVMAGVAGAIAGLTGCGGGGGSSAGSTPESVEIPAEMTLALGASTTSRSIGVIVTAGQAGAPAGFTLQWVRASELAVWWGLWPSGSDGECSEGFCRSTLECPIALAPGQSTTVTVDTVPTDNGTATPAVSGLSAQTDYVFRALPRVAEGQPLAQWTGNRTFSTRTV